MRPLIVSIPPEIADYYKINLTDHDNDIIASDLDGCSMAFVEELIKSLMMKYKKHDYKYDEIKDVVERIKQHNKKFSQGFSNLGFN